MHHCVNVNLHCKGKTQRDCSHLHFLESCSNHLDPIMSISQHVEIFPQLIFARHNARTNTTIPITAFSIAGLWFIILQGSRQSVVFMINCACVSMASCRWSPSACRDSALSDRQPPAGRESRTTLDSTQHRGGKAGWVGGQMQGRPETSVFIPAWIKAQPQNITVTFICCSSMWIFVSSSITTAGLALAKQSPRTSYMYYGFCENVLMRSISCYCR